MSPESLLLIKPPIPHNQKPMSDKADPVEDPFKHKEATFPCLNSNNYSTWSKNCKHLLQAIDVWSYRQRRRTSTSKSRSCWKSGERSARIRRKTQGLQQTLPQSHKHHLQLYFGNSRPYIGTTEDPSEMWTILRQHSSKIGTSMQRTALTISFQQMKPNRRFLHTPARY